MRDGRIKSTRTPVAVLEFGKGTSGRAHANLNAAPRTLFSRGTGKQDSFTGIWYTTTSKAPAVFVGMSPSHPVRCHAHGKSFAQVEIHSRQHGTNKITIPLQPTRVH